MKRSIVVAAIVIGELGTAALLAQARLPTLAETKAWLESEAPPLMRAHSFQDDQHVVSRIEHASTGVHLDACALSWTQHFDLSTSSLTSPEKKSQSEHLYRLPLKDLETGALSIESDTLLSDEPVYFIRVTTRVAIGATIIVDKEKTSRGAGIYVRNREDGQRVANAIKRAAILCGAPVSAF